jgi:glycerate kinase
VARVLLAPDSFKGSASAADAALALARGWRSVRPEDTFDLRPMADGGEGTLDAVHAAVPGSEHVPVEVLGPLGRRHTTSWLSLPNGEAVVELAAASGLLLLDRDESTGLPELHPLDAHSFGTGEAIRSAVESGARRVHVGLGGSCSTDGGAGILLALGVELLDRGGERIPLGNRGLAEIASVDEAGLMTLPPDGVCVWSDVDAPLVGDCGAAAVFGPQKGMSAAQIAAADAGLAHFASRLGLSAATAGYGAAGGAGSALAWLGASLMSGAEAVANTIGVPRALEAADVVITGEGKFDRQSAGGKVPWRVRELARRHDVPVMLVAGLIEEDAADFADSRALVDLAGDARASRAHALHYLEAAGASLAERWTRSPATGA